MEDKLINCKQLAMNLENELKMFRANCKCNGQVSEIVYNQSQFATEHLHIAATAVMRENKQNLIVSSTQ